MQKVFWSWKDDDLTLDLSREYNGILPSGLYAGFDFVPAAGMALLLSQGITGKQEVQKDKTMSGKFAIVKTQQGMTVREYDDIVLNISATGGQGRTDLIVMQHEYVEVEGGSAAQYIVIEGAPGGALPALTVPNLQTVLGTLELPANVSTLLAPGVKYTKSPLPTLSGNEEFVRRKNGQLLGPLDANGQAIFGLPSPEKLVNDGDAVSWGTLKGLLRKLFPSTIVTMYSGSVDAIPAPWKLSDGTGNSPDLRDKFIRGAVPNVPTKLVGATGGSETVKLSAGHLPKTQLQIGTSGSHTHTGVTGSGGSHSHAGSIANAGDHSHVITVESDGTHSHTGNTENAGSHTHTGYTSTDGAHTHSYNLEDGNGRSDNANDRDVRIPAGSGGRTTGSAGSHSHALSINAAGDHTHSFTTSDSGAHTHNASAQSAGTHTHTISIAADGVHTHSVSVNAAGDHSHTVSEFGNDEAHENLPPFYTLAYIYCDVEQLLV